MATPGDADVDHLVLTALAADGGASLETWSWAAARALDHQAVVGAVKSLEAEGYVAATAVSQDFWQLTPEALGYVEKGSPEAQLFRAIPADGVDEKGLDALFSKDFVAIAKGKCMQRKWIAKDKASGRYLPTVRGVQSPYNAATGCDLRGTIFLTLRGGDGSRVCGSGGLCGGT